MFKILFSGFPATSSRGYLGWSTIMLVKDQGKNILFDTGSYNERLRLLEKLEQEGLQADDIDMVVMSHLHFDHALNFNQFPQAELLISCQEYDYATGEKGQADPFLPQGIAGFLEETNRLRLVDEGERLTENLALLHTPGHTPGSLSLLMEYDRKYVATGDAVKNASEFMTGPLDVSSEWLESRKRIQETAEVFIPGHDRPFSVDESGSVKYEGSTKIDIYADALPHGESRCTFTLNLEGQGEGQGDR